MLTKSPRAITKRGLAPPFRLARFTVVVATRLSLVIHFDLRLPNLVGHSLRALVGVFCDNDLFSDPRLLVDHSFLALTLSFDGPLTECVLVAGQRTIDRAPLDGDVLLAQGYLLL